MRTGKAKARFPDYSAAPPELKISDGEWKRIENAYGRRLPTTLRQAIIEATKILKFRAIFAKDQRIADVGERIKRIQKGAKALHAAFRGGQPTPIRWYGDLCIESHLFTDLANKPASSVGELIKLIESLDAACAGARNYLDRTEKNTPSERSVWDMWVRTLTSILRENDLPTSARKDSDKQKINSPPAFVALVRELQESLPKAYGRSFHSYEALAQQISRARR
jgi:hypothetical protein